MKIGDITGDVNGLWQVAHDSGEFASAVSSYTISGLDGDTDLEYQLICRFVDDTTVGDYKLTFNTDTGTNYGYQHMSGVSSTASASRDTSEAYLHIGQTSTDDYICFSTSTISCKSGKIRAISTEYAYDVTGTTVTGIINRGSIWTNTADNLIQMVITATGDNMNVGTRIILLKKVHATDGMKVGELDVQGDIDGAWKRIYSTTLASAATSHTITGLTGDTDVLYRLVVRVLDDTTIGWTNIRFNTDTGTNYGFQRLQGGNTTVSAARETNNTSHRITYTGTDGNSGMFDGLIYAKSGYVRTTIGRNVNDISGTTVTDSAGIYGYSWNNTSDEITQIQILASADNLGIGTVIELWKLNL